MYQDQHFTEEHVYFDSTGAEVRRVKLSPESAANLKPSSTHTDVEVTADFDDPMSAVWLLAHLRTLLHGPDVERVNSQISVAFTGLSAEAVKALETYVSQSWQCISVGVLKRKTVYRSEHQPAQQRADSEGAA